jgi:hypothetical protein
MFRQDRLDFSVQPFILKETSPGTAISFRRSPPKSRDPVATVVMLKSENLTDKSILVTVEILKFASRNQHADSIISGAIPLCGDRWDH